MASRAAPFVSGDYSGILPLVYNLGVHECHGPNRLQLQRRAPVRASLVTSTHRKLTILQAATLFTTRNRGFTSFTRHILDSTGICSCTPDSSCLCTLARAKSKDTRHGNHRQIGDGDLPNHTAVKRSTASKGLRQGWRQGPAQHSHTCMAACTTSATTDCGDLACIAHPHPVDIWFMKQMALAPLVLRPTALHYFAMNCRSPGLITTTIVIISHDGRIIDGISYGHW